MRCAANYAPLSPLSFLERSAVVYADRTAVVYGSKRYTWRQTRNRCIMMASALARLGISRGDIVWTLSLLLFFSSIKLFNEVANLLVVVWICINHSRNLPNIWYWQQHVNHWSSNCYANYQLRHWAEHGFLDLWTVAAIKLFYAQI